MVCIKSIRPSFHATEKIILKVICSECPVNNSVHVAINFNISEAFVVLILRKYALSGLKYWKGNFYTGVLHSQCQNNFSRIAPYLCSTVSRRYGAWLRQYVVWEVVQRFSSRWQEQLCVQHIPFRLCVIYFLLKL